MFGANSVEIRLYHPSFSAVCERTFCLRIVAVGMAVAKLLLDSWR